MVGALSTRINHVSINARDLQESVDFYVELLGAELIPTPNFGLPVQWLALERTQLHLPGDVVQLYLRDPAGNLVEIDHSGIDRLPEDIRTQVKPLWEFNPQSEEQMQGRLFLSG